MLIYGSGFVTILCLCLCLCMVVGFYFVFFFILMVFFKICLYIILMYSIEK